MNAPRRLVFWRHGRTEWNAQMRFQGQTDIPLDDVGLAQAERAAAMLATLNPSIIIASDLVRAHQTAQALARQVGIKVTTDARLRETFAGDWEGLTRDVLESQYGPELAAWSAFSDVRPGGHGETRIEVADRMEAAVRHALPSLEAGQTMVVATHGGAARTAIGRLLGLPHETWGALGVLTNCSWSVLVENLSGQGSSWRLQEYNAGTLPEPAFGDDR
jgi:glucosyl-3-phosphoglycerate phosphatase